MISFTWRKCIMHEPYLESLISESIPFECPVTPAEELCHFERSDRLEVGLLDGVYYNNVNWWDLVVFRVALYYFLMLLTGTVTMVDLPGIDELGS